MGAVVCGYSEKTKRTGINLLVLTCQTLPFNAWAPETIGQFPESWYDSTAISGFISEATKY